MKSEKEMKIIDTMVSEAIRTLPRPTVSSVANAVKMSFSAVSSSCERLKHVAEDDDGVLLFVDWRSR